MHNIRRLSPCICLTPPIEPEAGVLAHEFGTYTQDRGSNTLLSGFDMLEYAARGLQD